jgi:DNA-binding transcriptional ArsR family regulator
MVASQPLPEPDPPNPPETARRPATEAEARALASSLRLRIIHLCHEQPLTNREIADQLDRDPASVLHHVRRLLDTGFLEALPIRRGRRGARERPYRSTGKSWTLQVGDSQDTTQATDAMLNAFLAELADAGGKLANASRLTLRLTPDDWEEFSRRISAVLDEFAARPPDPDGQWWSVFFAMHASQSGTAQEATSQE